MMNSGAGNPKNRILLKGFSAILIIAACIILTAPQLGADSVFKSAGTLKAFKIKKFKVPIVIVSVPLQISDVPEPWRDADLVVESLVLFYKGNAWKSGLAGISYGQTIKPQALTNGSSQGMVHVSIVEVEGVTTGQYATFSIAVAKLGDQCKILGFGCNVQGGGCPPDDQEKFENAIDMVIPWSDPILRSDGLMETMN